MTETYTAGAITALEAQPYREEVFVEIEFPGYTFRASSLARDYIVDGELYTGAGPLGSISGISENADMAASPVTLTLTGLDASLAAELRDFTHQGSPMTVKIVFFDSSDVFIADPVTVFIGVIDTLSWEIGATLAITVTADSYLRLLFRGPDGRRRMQGDQEQIFPGDKGLEFAGSLFPELNWGVPQTIKTATTSSGRDPRSKFGRIP